MNAEELLKKLDAERDAYLASLQQLHEALTRTVFASNASTPASSAPARPLFDRVARLSMGDSDRKAAAPLSSLYKSSMISGEEEELSDDDEALYVQEVLKPAALNDEDLRSHLKKYGWDDSAKRILEPILTIEGRLKVPSLFPTGNRPGDDGLHISLYQVFAVGADGAPLALHSESSTTSQAMWHIMKDINTDARKRQAVGRITILREPSPTMFAASHLAMKDLFDMDEIFEQFVQQGTTAAFIPRPFSDDTRHQRSFVFSFEYFTVIGDDCEPMTWQESDKPRERKPDHIPISRCSSVVALSLVDQPLRKIKNSARRAKNEHGNVYSPWSPWHVLNIQCYPDWKSDTESHDSTKHYVNGPEAFLNTLLAEYKDAQKRFEDLCQRVSKLVTPPADFMFNGELRDKLLFEDSEFTYSRRYFWAFQTLGTMNQSIKAIIDSYEDTFTKDVWEGRHKIIWPLIEDNSLRNTYWKKRMASLKKDFEAEIHALKTIMGENDDRRKEIKSLRDNLFSGTSVLESRKSVEQSEITVEQGHNIKLLTLVNMFFLPLTFVTSVFGMTNMDSNASFWRFGVVLVTVCVPFFLLIGSMNTNRGMRFWREQFGTAVLYFFAIIKWPWQCGAKKKATGDGEKPGIKVTQKQGRSLSASEGMARRMGRPAADVISGTAAEKKSNSNANSNSGLSSKKPEPDRVAEELGSQAEHTKTRERMEGKRTTQSQPGPSVQTQPHQLPVMTATPSSSYARSNAVSESNSTEERSDSPALRRGPAAYQKNEMGIWDRLRTSRRRASGENGKVYPV